MSLACNGVKVGDDGMKARKQSTAAKELVLETITDPTGHGKATGDAMMAALIEEVRGLRADLRALTGAVLNREQATSLLGISVRNLHDLVKQGSIKRVALSTGRYGFRREELDRYLSKNGDRSLDSAQRWHADHAKK
ncbi:MAG: helix-turn-helix domain-containing protein [Candidatus Hydrogenedentes bacterium]|nr:helix-turn-helix domain-containing protein [Candidatus Hydrogenedentota bacterium]